MTRLPTRLRWTVSQLTWLLLLRQTGLSIPNVPNYVGAEHLQVYDSMSVDPDDYRGQSLLVVGNGNSAFETVRLPSTVAAALLVRGIVRDKP